MSLLERIRACNAHDLSRFLPFVIGGIRVGWVRPAFARRLARFPRVFEVGERGVALAPGLDGFAARTEAVAEVVAALAAEGVIVGLRDEPYPVTTAFTAPPLLQIERAAVPHFGLRAFGIHVNGLVRGRGGLALWIARRAADKPTYPGMLDNFVAGGQPVGLSLGDNLVKEAAEEAGVPAEIARRAVPVGATGYVMEVAAGLKPDVQFVYDLELPPDFTPENRDGEIAEFMLWPVKKVRAVTAETTEFKPNCDLVNIDFFLRHGVVTPDDPDYLALVFGLHQSP